MTEREKRLAQVREAKRTYREKMRAAGFRELTVWVTPAQHKAVMDIAPQKVIPDPRAKLTPGECATWKAAAESTWSGKRGPMAHNLEAVREQYQEASHDDMRWSWRAAARSAGIEREEPNEAELCEAVRYLYRRGWTPTEIATQLLKWSLSD
ncbi:MAG: hypothetical protein M0003_18200 [Acidithiobacillus sp.]|nr:hypothetical protein [Acidithiobacillus sp.]